MNEVAAALIFVLAAVVAGWGTVLARRSGADTAAPPPGPPAVSGRLRQPHTEHSPSTSAEVKRQASDLVDRARIQAIEARETAMDELRERQAALEATDAVLADRELHLTTLNQKWSEHRHSLRERREEVDSQLRHLEAERSGALDMIADKAAISQDDAVKAVLRRIEGELAGEHAGRVDRAVTARTDDPLSVAQNHVAEAIQRQDASHTEGGQRPGPISLDDLSDEERDQLVGTLEVVAAATGTELGVDAERRQATLRGLDPIGREVARQASAEVVERHVQAADVHPLVITLRRSLSSRIAEIGERAMWEMNLDGRPELAELVGTLHYRFSYGQNALLHCMEAGYLCGVLAAELGMPFEQARRAGMLHDIGKAVDHDVEGSHAIIGGELLDVFGTPVDLTHAVKAHHFDVEPSSDLALLTICADAISASRPGARRDSMTTYLARLEQLQDIATRHRGVERAFPLQAGREVRISVRPRSVGDAQVPILCAQIAREIEAEMQYPGMIKVTVIRTTTASASSAQPDVAPAGEGRPKRRRGGRGRESPESAEGAPGGGGGIAVAVASPLAEVGFGDLDRGAGNADDDGETGPDASP